MCFEKTIIMNKRPGMARLENTLFLMFQAAQNVSLKIQPSIGVFVMTRSFCPVGYIGVPYFLIDSV